MAVRRGLGPWACLSLHSTSEIVVGAWCFTRLCSGLISPGRPVCAGSNRPELALLPHTSPFNTPPLTHAPFVLFPPSLPYCACGLLKVRAPTHPPRRCAGDPIPPSCRPLGSTERRCRRRSIPPGLWLGTLCRACLFEEGGWEKILGLDRSPPGVAAPRYGASNTHTRESNALPDCEIESCLMLVMHG